jgi:hypothetical protein
MQLTNSVLLLAGLAAGASIHKHRHADLHADKRDEVVVTMDGKVVSWANTYDVATPVAEVAEAVATTTAAAAAATSATTTAAAASATGTATSSTSASEEDTYVSFTDYCASYKSKRATDAEISYTGNVGSPYGCNQMLVSSTVADKYDYTVKFTGQNTADWKVVCWNKIGPDGELDGWYGNAVTEFTLGAGETQYVAFDADSQGGCAAAEGTSIPTDTYGGYASTWFEFDFADTANSGWSGADISSIQAQAAGLTVQGMQACFSGTCSTITEGCATVDNAFDEAAEYEDGLGINTDATQVSIDVIVAYSA